MDEEDLRYSHAIVRGIRCGPTIETPYLALSNVSIGNRNSAGTADLLLALVRLLHVYTRSGVDHGRAFQVS